MSQVVVGSGWFEYYDKTLCYCVDTYIIIYKHILVSLVNVTIAFSNLKAESVEVKEYVYFYSQIIDHLFDLLSITS